MNQNPESAAEGQFFDSDSLVEKWLLLLATDVIVIYLTHVTRGGGGRSQPISVNPNNFRLLFQNLCWILVIVKIKILTENNGFLISFSN